ncbi:MULTISPECIES: LysR family transcriptional regulator [Halomonadaceae]|uniref:LysR family transcriptional regulator n=2 Tax=Vreelandella TaxID=3137766 RepID=A0A7Z0LPS3_9GAMM|nr:MULTISPECIES: LysR family transcriptional regulator [Halomonas]NYS76357.1 LysR family transcriptional regulator [Halomonas glaciei]
MRHMRGEWLVAFVAVVETGSFTDAAKRMHRTQSAVSMQIQQLEAAAATSLLARARSGVIPTPAGERLLPYARRTAEALYDASTLFEAPELSSGPLRVGIPEEYSGTELPRLLSRFQRSQPKVELFVQCASSDRLGSAIEKGALDLGLIVADDERRRGDALLYDPTWWVMAEDFELPVSEPLPLVLFDQACWWRQWALDRMSEIRREWRIAYTSDSIAGVAAAVQAGLGIGVLGFSTMPEGVCQVPKSLGLPNLPGSHLVLQLADGNAPRSVEMARLIQQHFTSKDYSIGGRC